MWIFTKEVLARGQILTPEKEEYFKRRLMSITVCMNWDCAVLLMITSGCQKHNYPACGRGDGHRTGLQNRYSACGAMVHDTVKSNMGTTRYNIAKYHEAVNCAHTDVVHVDNRGWGFVQDTKEKLGHEQEVGLMGDGR